MIDSPMPGCVCNGCVCVVGLLCLITASLPMIFHAWCTDREEDDESKKEQFIQKGRYFLEKVIGKRSDETDDPLWMKHSYMFPPICNGVRRIESVFRRQNARYGPSSALILEEHRTKTGEQYNPDNIQSKLGNIRGFDAEVSTFAAVESIGQTEDLSPVITFWSVPFTSKLIEALKDQLGLEFPIEDAIIQKFQNPNTNLGEIDLLCLQREVGLVIIEVKSVKPQGSVFKTKKKAAQKLSDRKDGVSFPRFFKQILEHFIGSSAAAIPVNSAIVISANTQSNRREVYKGIPVLYAAADGSGLDVSNLFSKPPTQLPEGWFEKAVPIMAEIFQLAIQLKVDQDDDEEEHELDENFFTSLQCSQILAKETWKIEHHDYVEKKMRKTPEKLVNVCASLELENLTKEQEDALKENVNAHTLLFGHGGTGRTTTVIGRIIYLLDKEMSVESPTDVKQRFLVFTSRNGQRRFMRRLTKAVNILIPHRKVPIKNWVHVHVHEELCSHFPKTFRAISETSLQRGEFQNFDLKTTFSGREVKEELQGYSDQTVLVDDIPIEEENAATAFILGCLTEKPFQSLLATADVPGDDNLLSKFRLCDENLTRFQTVVRQGRNIYMQCHARHHEMNWDGCRTCDSFIGHRLFGFTTRKFEINDKSPGEIAQLIQYQLDYFLGPIRVIEDLEKAIVLVAPNTVDIGDLKSALEQAPINIATKAVGEEIVEGDDKPGLAMDLPCNCISMEWPIVFYFRRSGSGFSRDDIFAMSRCTTALVLLELK